MNSPLNIGPISASFIWASVLWGAISSGYVIYGWKQRSMIPFIGGLVMSAACFFPSALVMSLLCIAAMFGVWWFLKQGY